MTTRACLWPARAGTSRFLLAIVVVGLAVFSTSLSTAQQAEPRSPAVHALLVNGGSQPAANYLSHLHHLQEMVELLDARGIARERIHIFSADGEDPAADLASRNTRPEAFWLIEGTRVGRALRPQTELTDTRWPGVTLLPARRADLRHWFETTGKNLQAGDGVLFFVTDHGTENRQDPDNGAISLWQEELTVREFEELLILLPPGVKVVMAMSQCYSGSFASAIFAGGEGRPEGDLCGFFSTHADMPAYGCYPEGRDQDRLGHAFQTIDALGRHTTTDAAHLDVLVADNTPDVPLRTSDVFLERLLEREARQRGLDLERLVDSLLEVAWRDKAAWEPEIRLLDRIGDTFGMFSPRSLVELEAHASRLPGLSDQMGTYAAQWRATLRAVKEENLRSLMRADRNWRERLRPEALQAVDAEAREVLLDQVLPALEWHARDQPVLWQRLESLREKADRASEARWRIDVRRAAVLRMRATLLGIAGRTLLAESREGDPLAADSRSLAALLACERFAPGQLPAARSAGVTSAVESYPPLADELTLLESVLPSWLGVQFGPVPEGVAQGRDLLAGAATLQAVYPDSPASEAGLEAGDIILGPPERHFEAAGQLREWTFTSPRDAPLPLDVLRPRIDPGEDERLEFVVFLEAFPMEWPELPGPPQVGERAPLLPSGLQPVTATWQAGDFTGQPHLLFFWATWCLPCKKAVPEVLAFAQAEGLDVLAISDESVESIESYLSGRDEPFFANVAADPLRRSFIAHGVSGTPTLVVIDRRGLVTHRLVGYDADSGLEIAGWSWQGRP